MSLEYSQEDKEKIEAAINSEINSLDTKSQRELLRLVHDSVFHLNPTDAVKLMRTQARFATLLVKLSEQADATARRIVWLTWALIALTAALLIFTVYLYKDTHTLVKQEQAAQPHEVKNP